MVSNSVNKIAMKRTIAILGAIVVMIVTAIVVYRWDSEKNRGYTWGYWGEFNTVSNSLAQLPGVNITKVGCNADVTMEEFGFNILTSEGDPVNLYFGEQDPIRKLSGKALSKALLEKIKKESSSKPTSGNAWKTSCLENARDWHLPLEQERTT
jgi:hypothetical protein